MERSRDNWNIAQFGMSPPDDTRSDYKRAAGFIPAVCIRSFIRYSLSAASDCSALLSALTCSPALGEAVTPPPPPLHVHNYIRFPQLTRWLRAAKTPMAATAAWVTGYGLRVTAAWARVIRATKRGISRPREAAAPRTGEMRSRWTGDAHGVDQQAVGDSRPDAPALFALLLNCSTVLCSIRQKAD